MLRDMHSAGMGFLPIAVESTGALGRMADEQLVQPLLSKVKRDDDLRALVHGRLSELDLPWGARGLRGCRLSKPIGPGLTSRAVTLTAVTHTYTTVTWLLAPEASRVPSTSHTATDAAMHVGPGSPPPSPQPYF